MAVVLLGPQRFRPSVRNTIRSLAPDGPVATVTAGWREREPDDTELDGLLDGRSINLGLYGRWLDVHERDPELAAAVRRRDDVLDELQSVYILWLDHALAAVTELVVRDFRAQIAATAIDDTIQALRDIDRRHLERVSEVRDEFYAQWQPHERPAVAEHRAAVAGILGECAAVTIAGGHVGALLGCLALFDVAPALVDTTVVGWSAGAMALTDKVVLFNDRSPDGRSYAEVYRRGLGLCRRVVALPHARRRLLLDDPVRMSVFARRFAPARCVVLDDGVRLDCADGELPHGTRVLTSDGRVEDLAEVSA
ncbi:MAG TPA: hypothetical protein VM307_00115 [Egibacteraceae bacterium]|nr:hypothetical protein [Egibacteraceae bacterium]